MNKTIRNFEPTSGIWKTAKSISVFNRENIGLLIRLWLPIMPIVILFEAMPTYMLAASKIPENIGLILEFLLSAISFYLTTMLAINWHRAFLSDPYDFQKANPLKPKGREWAFISLALASITILTISNHIFENLEFLQMAAFGYLCVSAVCLTWLFLRISFYLPAMALGHNITLKQAFKLSKGYVWKILATFSIASVKMTIISLIILAIAYINIDMHTNIVTFGDYEPNRNSVEYLKMQEVYESKLDEIIKSSDYKPNLNPEDYATTEEYNEAIIDDAYAAVGYKAALSPEVQAAMEDLSIASTEDMFAKTALLISILMGIVSIYAIPVGIAIWVAALSNFYQHALRARETA